MTDEIEFISKVTTQQALDFMDGCMTKNIPYFLISEWGAVGDDDAKFVIELGEENDSWIATRSFLQESKDGVFVHLKKDGKEVELPEFDDVFEMTEFK